MADTTLDLLRKEIAALTEKIAELRADLLAVVNVLEDHRDSTTQQTADMKADLNAVTNALESEHANNTYHIKEIYRAHGEYLYPAFQKLFPDYQAVQEQIEKIIGPKEPPKNS